MLANQGISAQIDVSNMAEIRRPEENDCKVVPITHIWKSKNPGYGGIRHKDSHHAVFMEEKQPNFPQFIQMIPRSKITLSEKYKKLETRA